MSLTASVQSIPNKHNCVVSKGSISMTTSHIQLVNNDKIFDRAIRKEVFIYLFIYLFLLLLLLLLLLVLLLLLLLLLLVVLVLVLVLRILSKISKTYLIIVYCF